MLVQSLLTREPQDDHKVYGTFRRSRERSNKRYRDSSCSRSRSYRPNNPPRVGSECWYHWKFGDKALKCVKPCSFNDSKDNQTREN